MINLFFSLLPTLFLLGLFVAAVFLVTFIIGRFKGQK